MDTAGTDAILVAASIYAEADNTFSSSVNATELVFAVGKSETAAEKMRLDQDGQLGIGLRHQLLFYTLQEQFKLV